MNGPDIKSSRAPAHHGVDRPHLVWVQPVAAGVVVLADPAAKSVASRRAKSLRSRIPTQGGEA